jgi:hypothetical protein
MNKKIFMGLILPLVLLFVVSCQKESVFQPQENSKEAAFRTASAGGCRMTSYDYYDGIADYHNILYITYKNGLVDDILAFGQRFNMEYDAKGNMIASKVYVGETLVNTIDFIYEKNRVVQEIWKDGTSHEIVDRVFNTYNKQGNMIRNESTNFGYYTTYTYTANGSLESWQVFVDGLPVSKAEYTYNDNYKNPFKSLASACVLIY